MGFFSPVKIAQIEICCCTSCAEKKFPWHQLRKEIREEERRGQNGVKITKWREMEI